jgi:tetratricopeptide (TPR) repeat protein
MSIKSYRIEPHYRKFISLMSAVCMCVGRDSLPGKTSILLICRSLRLYVECMNDSSSHKPVLLTNYRRYLRDRDTVEFVTFVKQRYRPGTLEHLARSPDIELRRAALFSLGFVGDYSVHVTVGRALQDDDPIARRLAMSACRFVWNRPKSRQQRQRLVEIIRLNAQGEYHYAAEQAAELVDDVPSLAEAWYQLAAANFQLDDFDAAAWNCHRALELNPYHYVAATAMGESFLLLDETDDALEAFRRALKLNPALNKVRQQIIELARQLDGDPESASGD